MSGLSPGTRALIGLRLAIGFSSWVFPNFVTKLFGVDPKVNAQGPYVMRLFAIRELALAFGVLASKGEARKTWLKLGVLCDAADVAAAGLGRRDGHLSTMTAILTGGTAAGAAAAGAVVLSDGDKYPTPV